MHIFEEVEIVFESDPDDIGVVLEGFSGDIDDGGCEFQRLGAVVGDYFPLAGEDECLPESAVLDFTFADEFADFSDLFDVLVFLNAHDAESSLEFFHPFVFIFLHFLVELEDGVEAEFVENSVVGFGLFVDDEFLVDVSEEVGVGFWVGGGLSFGGEEFCGCFLGVGVGL